ncbi:MAG: IS21 family transposase [Pseudobdellovibrionaceae bacterium]|nr:IS21 family transposase [Pseudobdellovibrionaceae bacterium]
MIDPETRAAIRRLHFNQHFTINAVAEALGIHHETVRRAISTSRVESCRIAISDLEQYEAKVLETLSIYPKLSASRIYLMLKEQGYKGRLRTVQRWVKPLRPRVAARVFQEVHVLPGEQAQVDWGSFGSLSVGKAKRRLNAFVIVLSYSRAIYVRFTFDQTLESLLECHRHSFQYFSGIPRNIFYDNMRTVVSDRIGSKIRFQKDLLNFAAHYLFAPNACGPYQPQSKGRVERAIRFLRENFFIARDISTIEQLNMEVLEWCKQTVMARSWPDDASFSVQDRFAFEQQSLLKLPENDLPTRRHLSASADAYGFVRFDSNRYSVPPSAQGRSLILAVDHDNVLIYSEGKLIAGHPRSWDSGKKVEDPIHEKQKSEQRPKQRISGKALDLIVKIPSARQLLELSIDHDQTNTSTILRWLRQTLDVHGQNVAETIIEQALSGGTYALDGLRSLLRIELNKADPQMELLLPDKIEVKNLEFRSHSLETYDQL